MSRPRRQRPEAELEHPGEQLEHQRPYPPYVVSNEEKRRWDLCLLVAEETSKLREPSGVADSTFVWYTTRALYRSDIPTGSPGDSLG